MAPSDSQWQLPPLSNTLSQFIATCNPPWLPVWSAGRWSHCCQTFQHQTMDTICEHALRIISPYIYPSNKDIPLHDPSNILHHYSPSIPSYSNPPPGPPIASVLFHLTFLIHPPNLLELSPGIRKINPPPYTHPLRMSTAILHGVNDYTVIPLQDTWPIPSDQMCDHLDWLHPLAVWDFLFCRCILP